MTLLLRAGRRFVWSALASAAWVSCALVAAPAACAQSDPSPAPSPSPTARPGSFALGVDGHTTFITQSTSGPGRHPSEGPAFATGSPLSPLTPYDTFSSAPLTPGTASEGALVLRPVYTGRGALTIGGALALGYAAGSVTNAAYWGEPLVPALNPHLGSQRLPYAIVFPDHPGRDDGAAASVEILHGEIATKNGNARLRAGWFDLAQSDAFVFAAPPVTNAAPSTGIATPESLGDGPPAIDAWQASPPTLPLHGIDFTGKGGIAALEVTSAALPSLPGTGARMNQISLAFDRGGGTRYSAQLVHVSTGGDPIATTILYGADPQLTPTPQGPLPASTIGGQRQTIAGLRAAFPLAAGLAALLEAGRSTYAADRVAEPGTERPGSYAHAGLTESRGRASLALDWYRNDARYATELLPYGVPENVWSVAWSWPGQWLKSNYQLIANAPVNINRQGYRLKYVLGGGPLDVRAAYANFGQIDPISRSNALRTGFIDGFFLPQDDAVATLGRQHQYGLFLGWHPRFADVTLDYSEDTMRRPAAAHAPLDTVSYDAPEAVLTVSRRLSTGVLVSAGLARYGMRGSFGQASTNIDFAQRNAFAALELGAGARTATLVTLRRTAFGGRPAAIGDPSPDFTGTLLVVEQRLRL